MTTATDTNTIIEELVEAVFCVGSVQRLCEKNQLRLFVNSETGRQTSWK
jgi:hypothetical protein